MKTAAAAAACRRPEPRGATVGDYLKSAFTKLAEIEAAGDPDEAVVTKSRRRTYSSNTMPKPTFENDLPRDRAAPPPTLAGRSSTTAISSSTSPMSRSSTTAISSSTSPMSSDGRDDDDEDDEGPDDVQLLQPPAPVPPNPCGVRESSKRRICAKGASGVLKVSSPASAALR